MRWSSMIKTMNELIITGPTHISQHDFVFPSLDYEDVGPAFSKHIVSGIKNVILTINFSKENVSMSNKRIFPFRF